MFLIGKIVNTQGIRGEMRVVPATDDPSRFELLKTLTLRSKAGDKNFALKSVRYHKQFVIIKLEGIEDMTAAEKLKGTELWIDDTDALPLGENEYYARDLYGLKVYENGILIGEITDVFSTGSNDVYTISMEGEKPLYLPAIKSCVLKVDIAEGIMEVSVSEGLR